MISLKTIKNHSFQLTATVGVFIVSILAISLVSTTAHAAPVVGFNPGYIISDNIMTNSQSMNASQIQAFLNSKVPTCDTAGTQVASDFGSTLTHAQYAATRGWAAPPYTCLKDYTQNGLSAAQIIYNVAQQYQINPQVLIVLLQKEQGLVTDTWPLSSEYTTATGYGCPDNTGCNNTYYGFTNQVTWAATMYHAIMTSSTNWYSTYTVGNNFILWNPNTACGGTTVNIQNLATAALYDYTPYQPDQAALNAGYGNGDSCSSYGNRNFYEYFNDWFGSPLYGNLVRTVDNSSVYLISDGNKYPISDISLLAALSPLGGVSFVTQSYLDSQTTGPTLGRVIRSSNGTVYFYDSGIKLPFGTCTQVQDYGSSCGQAIQLDDSLINLLSSGPGMTSLLQTTSGKLFNVVGGVKKEVFDNASLVATGNTDGVNVLSEASINNLPYGTPIIRNNVVVTDRTNGQKYLYTNNIYYNLPTTQANYSYIQSLPNGILDDNSILTGQINNNFNGFITDTTTGNEYILMPQGEVQLTTPAAWGAPNSSVSDSLVTSLPIATNPINNGIVMTPGNGTVYYVTGGVKRPIPGWSDLVDLNIQPFTLNTLDAVEMSAIPTGPSIYAPGHMVKTANSSTVYIVTGYTELSPISNFLFAQELGTPSTLETISSADFGNYQVGPALQTQISCNGQDYVGTNGTLYPMSASDLANFGLVQTNFVDAGLLCGALPKSSQSLPNFLLDGTGTIYLIQSGAKHAFTGYTAYLANGGTPQNTLKVSNYFTSLIPSGANISH